MKQLGQSAVVTAAGKNVWAKPSEPATASKCHWGAAKSHLTPQQKNGPPASQNQTQLLYTSMQEYPRCLYNLPLPMQNK